MKYTRIFLTSLVSLVMVLVFSLHAHASLDLLGTDSLGNRLIYDTDFDITWYDYSNTWSAWQNQLTWSDALSVTFESNTYTDWRLPTALNQDGSGPCGPAWYCTNSEMGHLYYTELGNVGYPFTGYGLSNTGDFQNLSVGNYWSAEYAQTTNAWIFTTDSGYQFSSAGGNGYALAVHAGKLSIVPEPISSTLFIVGGVTLGFRRFRKKFKK